MNLVTIIKRSANAPVRHDRSDTAEIDQMIDGTQTQRVCIKGGVQQAQAIALPNDDTGC
jgi:hypothetical protein